MHLPHTHPPHTLTSPTPPTPPYPHPLPHPSAEAILAAVPEHTRKYFESMLATVELSMPDGLPA